MIIDKRFILVVLPMALLLTAGPVLSQEHDRVWLGGANIFPGEPGNGHFGIFFSADTALTQGLSPLAFNFDAAALSICDENGELLFYSNGCQIANASGEILSNGESMSPGVLSEDLCPTNGHFGPQSLLAIPWPNQPGRYCLLQSSIAFTETRQWRYDQLLMSKVDMTSLGGQGALTISNALLYSGDVDPPVVVRHGNGRDWWIILPEYKQQKFQRFLLTPTGPTPMPATTAGAQPLCEKSGASCMSPSGQLLARWTECAIMVYGFDRCTGEISATATLPTPTRWLPGGGIAFSPSGRYVYASSYTTLYRADLESAVPQLDTLFYAYDPWLMDSFSVNGVSFQYMQLGPDNRIYIVPSGRANYWHVIQHPDAAARGEIGFIPKGFSLPGLGIRTLPRFPNYRLFDLSESNCDTLGINAPTSLTEPDRKLIANWQVMPNPTDGPVYFTLDHPSPANGQLKIFDSFGETAIVLHWPTGMQTQKVVLTRKGLYFSQWSDGVKTTPWTKIIVVD